MASFIFALIALRAALITYYGLKATKYVFSQPNWHSLMHKVDAFEVAPKQFISFRKWTYKQFYPEFK